MNDESCSKRLQKCNEGSLFFICQSFTEVMAAIENKIGALACAHHRRTGFCYERVVFLVFTQFGISGADYSTCQSGKTLQQIWIIRIHVHDQVDGSAARDRTESEGAH